MFTASHRGKGMFTAVQSPRERLFTAVQSPKERVVLQLCCHREKGVFTAVQGLFTVV